MSEDIAGCSLAAVMNSRLRAMHKIRGVLACQPQIDLQIIDQSAHSSRLVTDLSPLCDRLCDHRLLS
jgi:hypothetical protein